MGINYRWYRGNKDINGVEFKEGDIVRGRANVGIIWKDVVGVVEKRGTDFYLIGNQVAQILSEVNRREIIGHISKNPELLDQFE